MSGVRDRGGIVYPRKGIPKVPFDVCWVREEPWIEGEGVAFADAVEIETKEIISNEVDKGLGYSALCKCK